MRGMKISVACLILGIVNIITMGSYKSNPPLEMTTSLEDTEEADYLGLKELYQKLDSVNSNLDSLHYEQISNTTSNRNTNK